MKKNTKIILAILTIFGLGYLVLEFNILNPETRTMIARCNGYKSEWHDVVDCYGLISIWRWEDAGYAVINYTQVPWPQAFIRKADDFYVKRDELYLIDRSTGECGNGLNPHPYCVTFQVNGVRKEYSYDNANEVPHYLVFNTKTGNQRFYVQVSDIPSDEQLIFEQLSR